MPGCSLRLEEAALNWPLARSLPLGVCGAGYGTPRPVASRRCRGAERGVVIVLRAGCDALKTHTALGRGPRAACRAGLALVRGRSRAKKTEKNKNKTKKRNFQKPHPPKKGVLRKPTKNNKKRGAKLSEGDETKKTKKREIL